MTKARDHLLLLMFVGAAAAASMVTAHIISSQFTILQNNKSVSPQSRRNYVKRIRATRPAPFNKQKFIHTLEHIGVSFEAYFRLTELLFDEVVERIAPHLVKCEQQAARSAGHNITPEHRLAVALRWMAGAQWQDIAIAMYPISTNEIYNSIWMVVDAINNEYAGEWSYPTPGPTASEAERRAATNFYLKAETRFREKSPQQCLRGAIGAIDGCILRTQSPGKSVQNPSDYFCERKKVHGLLLMAASDADMIIRFWEIKFSPKCHDSTAWYQSSLGDWVSNGNLPHPFFFLGDKAFSPGSASLLTPGTLKGTTDEYKYVQSRGRMPVEQCFGLLVRTWGVLWRPLEVRFERQGPLVSCLIHLHNIRRASGSLIDINGGHSIRHHQGKLQWGIEQRRKSRNKIEKFTAWVWWLTYESRHEVTWLPKETSP